MNELKKYLVIFKFENQETNFEFVNIAKKHFNSFNKYEAHKDESSFYVKIPLEREDFIIALNHTLSLVNNEICKTDFVYFIHKFTKDYKETDNERDIIIGHQTVWEREKVWDRLSELFKDGKIYFKKDN